MTSSGLQLLSGEKNEMEKCSRDCKCEDGVSGEAAIGMYPRTCHLLEMDKVVLARQCIMLCVD